MWGVLVGRVTEVSALAGLLSSACAGQAGVLQLVGEAGVGKTTLVADAVTRAGDYTVLHAVGVRGESHIPFAGLQALLRPLQDLVPALAPVQSRAAAVALGEESGPVAGELILGAACLRLVAIAAEQAPVLIVADDVHWFDEESWRALSFAVRRISGERVAVVLSTRPSSRRQVEGVPTLLLGGLSQGDATSLLRGLRPDLAVDVCRQLRTRTAGNPLALVEAAHGLSLEQRRGGAALPEDLPTSDNLTAFFSARTAICPPLTRRLLLLAALEGRGDLAVLAAAAERQGMDLSALVPAEREGLVTLREQRVLFRHPLVEAAMLQEASAVSRRKAHAALAAALSGDAHRAAWHAASACVGPDAVVADALTDVATRAQLSAAPAAASAAFERAATLTPDPGVRAERLLLASEAALVAGATMRAYALASDTQAELLAVPDRGRPGLVRGRAAMLLGRPSEAGPLLLDSAGALDSRSAAAALAEAVEAALEAGDSSFAQLLATRAEQLPAAGGDRVLAFHLGRARSALLDLTGDLAGSVRLLRNSIDALTDTHAVGDSATVWLSLASAACSVGDVIAGRKHFVTAAALARGSGDLPRLVEALAGEAFAEHMLGQWTSACATGTRALDLMDEDRSPYLLADVLQNLAEIDAARGNEAICRQRCARVRDIAERLGLHRLALLADRREALLDLGLNRLDAAETRLRHVRQQQDQLGLSHPYLSPIPDLVEVCVRAGKLREAEELVSELVAQNVFSAHPQARARLLRVRALVAGDDEYRGLFEQSVALDLETGMDFLRARTLLCYGERLRRDRQRVMARVMLRGALEVFDSLDALPWSQRARLELAATGERLGAHEMSSSGHLTPQELQIAVLVAEGKGNKEVAATLFLSIRTVEFHLTRVYRKLAVANRAALASRLAGGVPSSLNR